MVRIENGRQMLLKEALNLSDAEDKEIKWEKNEEGTAYTATYEQKPTEDSSGKKLAGTKFTYRIDVLPQIANVTVTQQVIEPEGTKKKSGDDARPKTVEEATASLAQANTGDKSNKSTAVEEDNNNKKTFHRK